MSGEAKWAVLPIYQQNWKTLDWWEDILMVDMECYLVSVCTMLPGSKSGDGARSAWTATNIASTHAGIVAALHVVNCCCGDVSGGFVHVGRTVVGTVLAKTMHQAIVHGSSIVSANVQLVGAGIAGVLSVAALAASVAAGVALSMAALAP